MTAAKLAAALASVVLGAGIVVLSALPYTPGDTDVAVIRLAWRFPAQAIETCRAPSAEERASIPTHMQTDSVCSRTALPYRLEVRLDGEVVEDGPVVGAGVRSDRPMYVYREFNVRPGEYETEVRFGPEDTGESSVSAASRTSLSFVETLTLAAAQIALLTYDESTGRLIRQPE